MIFNPLPGRTEENHKRPQSGQPMSWLRYQLKTSQITSLRYYYYYTNLLGEDFLRNENPNSANAELSIPSYGKE
jgi:hypothetical protein